MPLVSTGSLVTRAHEAGVAVAAFNVITLEHAQSVVAAAERGGQPAILQISQNAVRYHQGALRPLALAALELARTASVPLAVHLDHADDWELMAVAAAVGLSSVMFDAAALAYARNVAFTRRAADWAHSRGLWIEAELGYVGGKPGAPASAHTAGVRTDPGEAGGYVAETGVDALAVAVGSAHAMATRTARLDMPLIARLRASVPVPLVLHGSSGVPLEQLREAARTGISKINVGTALNLALVRAMASMSPDTRDPRPALSAARDAMTAVASEVLDAVSG